MNLDFVILAAGKGSRLRQDGDPTPKPMRTILGVSLIERLLNQVSVAGFRRVLVVVGYQKEQVMAHIKALKISKSLDIEFCENMEFEKSNGISLLSAAKSKLSSEFIFSMCDHIFDQRVLNQIKDTPLHDVDLCLATDTKISEVFDLDDATKVLQSEGKITSIGKEIKDYNSIDVGIFKVNQNYLNSLHSYLSEHNDVSLSNGVSHLVSQGRAGTMDIQDAWWQDVDTPETAVYGEKLILNSLKKKSDVWIAKNINRPISLKITKYLVKTPITPNQFTAFACVISSLSFIFAKQGTYVGFLLAALVYKLASILDGCDGEIARLKFMSSRYGAWVDTIGDNLSHVFYFSGLALGLSKMHQTNFYINLGKMTMVSVGLLLCYMFFIIIKNKRGSLLFFEEMISNNKSDSMLSGLIKIFSHLMRRANFASVFLLLALLNLSQYVLYSAAAASVVVLLFLIYTRTFKSKNYKASV